MRTWFSPSSSNAKPNIGHYLMRSCSSVSCQLIEGLSRVRDFVIRFWQSIFMIVQLSNFVFYVLFLHLNGYLPSPFVGDKNDTFMDFYNTAYWSMDAGRYTEWHSVYPPLVFLLLKFIVGFFPAVDVAYDGFSLRSLWPEGGIFLVASYVISFGLAVALRISPVRNFGQWLYWSVFFSLSPPALFALERGNLIFLLVPLIALSIRSDDALRCIAEAIMINIKPYMALILITYIIKRDVNGFFKAISLNLTLFLVTGLLVDANFLEMLPNFFVFSDELFPWSPNELTSMAASSYVLVYVIDYRYYVSDLSLQRSSDILVLARIPIYFCYSICAFGLYRAFRFGGIVSQVIVQGFVILSIVCCLQSAGGYSLVFLIPLLVIFRDGDKLSRVGVFLILFILSPIDLFILDVKPGYAGISYLSGQFTDTVGFNTLATAFRPAFAIALLGVVVRLLHVGHITFVSDRASLDR